MGRQPKHIFCLTPEERDFLEGRKRSKKTNQTIKKRIQIILHMDKNNPNSLNQEQCAKKCKTSRTTVRTAVALFCEEGMDGLLSIQRNPNSDCSMKKFDGKDEAIIIATACSETPEGRAHWTVRFLAEKCTVLLERTISPTTVHRILTNNDLRPHMTEYWCIPEKESADFVCAMEDVLDIYERAEDPEYPVWCLDEKPYQLLGEAREPLPMRPGSVEKVDAEYVRNGHVSIFCMIKPCTGQIHQSVQEQRTAVDFANQVKWIVDEAEPEAKKVVLVMDNLNTHKLASLYKAFSPAEANRIMKKLEIHYTPVHGSWLDIAEIGINIITRQCLGQRFESIEKLKNTLNEWETFRNLKEIKINWKFTSRDSRVRLKSLYPQIVEIAA